MAVVARALPAGIPIRVVLGRFVVGGKTPPLFVDDLQARRAPRVGQLLDSASGAR
jgi:hypothetical protein